MDTLDDFLSICENASRIGKLKHLPRSTDAPSVCTGNMWVWLPLPVLSSSPWILTVFIRSFHYAGNWHTLRKVYSHIRCRLALELLLKWDVGHNNLEPFFTDWFVLYLVEFQTSLVPGMFVCSYIVKRKTNKQTKIILDSSFSRIQLYGFMHWTFKEAVTKTSVLMFVFSASNYCMNNRSRNLTRVSQAYGRPKTRLLRRVSSSFPCCLFLGYNFVGLPAFAEESKSEKYHGDL